MYSKSDEFQKMLPDLLAEYHKNKVEEVREDGGVYKPDGYLTTLHVVKSMAWRSLSDEEKDEYHEMARQAALEYRSAQDR